MRQLLDLTAFLNAPGTQCPGCLGLGDVEQAAVVYVLAGTECSSLHISVP